MTLRRDETEPQRPAPKPVENTATPAEDVEPSVARAFLSEDWMRRTAQAVAGQELGQLAGYHLLRVVQRGAQGTVYEAVEPRTARRVAIKRLPLLDHRAIETDRFERETDALASLGHPNVVALLAAPVDDGARLIVMEWIDGLPLDRWADETWTRLTAREAIVSIVTCVTKVANAVAAAHARGIMHRDLKPTNVLVLPSGEPKVLDFGLAKGLHADAETATRTGGFAGTPAWASPEQIAGDARDVDARTDVHALGLLLYRALAGRPAFDASLAILPLFEAIRTQTPEMPSKLRRGVARELDLITMQALAKDPTQRYQSAEGFARDLTRYLAGKPIDAHPPSARYLVRKFVGRHRTVTTLAAIAAMAVLGGTVASTLLAMDARDARRAAETRANEADVARTRAERMNGFFQNLLANLREREVAGDRARAKDILSLAAESIERAGVPRESEVDLRVTLGLAFYEIGDYARSAAEYQRAAQLLTNSGDSARLVRTLIAESQSLLRTTDRRRSADTARRALSILQTITPDSALLAETHAALARSLHYEGSQVDSLAESDLAIRIARAIDDKLTLANALSTRALALDRLGRLQEATAQAVEAATIAETIPSILPLDHARLLHNASYLLEQSGEADAALPFAESSLAIRETHFGRGHPATATAIARVAAVLRRQNRLDEAIANYERAIAISADQTPASTAVRGNTRRHLARTYELRAAGAGSATPASSSLDRDRAIDEYTLAAKELLAGEMLFSDSIPSIMKFLARSIEGRDGRDALLDFVLHFPRELAAEQTQHREGRAREIEALARSALAQSLVSPLNPPAFVADRAWMELFRADLAAIEASPEADAALRYTVELALCTVLRASADPANQRESIARAEALLPQCRGLTGELSATTKWCESLSKP